MGNPPPLAATLIQHDAYGVAGPIQTADSGGTTARSLVPPTLCNWRCPGPRRELHCETDSKRAGPTRSRGCRSLDCAAAGGVTFRPVGQQGPGGQCEFCGPSSWPTESRLDSHSSICSKREWVHCWTGLSAATNPISILDLIYQTHRNVKHKILPCIVYDPLAC